MQHFRKEHNKQGSREKKVLHANSDLFDPKKGKSPSFKIHKREKAEKQAASALDENLYVWHGNTPHVRLRVKVSAAAVVATFFAMSIAMVNMHSKEIITYFAARNVGTEVMSAAMEVDPDMVAAALNQIEVGGE